MMMMTPGEMWLGSTLASIMFLYTMIQTYFPYQFRGLLDKYTQRFVGCFNPYIQITFQEFVGEHLEPSEAYSAIQSYLAATSSKQAKRLKADYSKDSKNLVLSMDDNEEVPNEYQGVKLWWAANKSESENKSFSFFPSASSEKRFYKLTFHKRDRELIVGKYLTHVLDEGKVIAMRNRKRKLYTNRVGESWYGESMWSHVVFNHPASFGTLAMDLDKKNELIDDLLTFSKSKDYYTKIGKTWKRGYLLYGPPGTGKSTAIAAMAKLLNYDIYDLELTAVKDNTELRKLLIQTSTKSIIVIEDIDCSLDLTGQRKKKKDGKQDEDKEKDPVRKKIDEEEDSKKDKKVTLSGLLNFIDGLWSACGEERILVFTTNHVDKLDPALIRRGRMDKHIQLSYCTFQGFKVLAKNYLHIDSHELFDDIQKLLHEAQITPADVAENLMLKTFTRNTETCLESLIEALKKAKETGKLEAGKEMAKKTEIWLTRIGPKSISKFFRTRT